MAETLDFTIEHSSSQRLYLQLKEGLKNQIINGKLKSGERLPSIPEMSRMFDLSLQTVQNAVNELKQEGLLYSRLSKGVFVAQKNTRVDLDKEIKEICFLLCNMKYITPYYSKILNGVENEINSRGLYLNYRSLKARRFPKSIKEKNSTALLVTGEITPRMLELIKTSSLPFILVGDVIQRETIEQGVDIVAEDDSEAVYSAAQHLLGLGHREIAIITGPVKYSWSNLQIEAYERAYRDKNLQCNELLKIPASDTTVQAGYLAMKELLERVNSFTALIICDEDLTYGAVKMLRKKELLIPKHISAIGKGDTRTLQALGVRLTTIEGQLEEMGKIAVRQLIENSFNPSHRPGRIAFHSRLVFHNSTCRLNGKGERNDFK